jgi:hypothetical protein
MHRFLFFGYTRSMIRVGPQFLVRISIPSFPVYVRAYIQLFPQPLFTVLRLTAL